MIRFGGIALSAALTLCAAVPAFAGDQDFTLVNGTGYPIREVYLSPPSAKNWGNDVMGSDVLKAGSSVPIKFTKTSECFWDMKVVYDDDGTSSEWSKFDLCHIDKITLKYNRSSDETSAITE